MIFFIIRILDLVSTYLCMNKYGGWSNIEGAPMSQVLISKLGYGLFIPVNLLISFLAYLILKRIKYAVNFFSFVNGLVVVSNFLIFFYI